MLRSKLRKSSAPTRWTFSSMCQPSRRYLQKAPAMPRWGEMLAARAAEEALQRAAQELQFELTPRQRDVAELVSSGMSNQEIARQLVLEPGTVANHVAAILGRLGFRSRTQIAVWAAERGVGRQTPPSSPP